MFLAVVYLAFLAFVSFLLEVDWLLDILKIAIVGAVVLGVLVNVFAL
jgi:hypothetical protein